MVWVQINIYLRLSERQRTVWRRRKRRRGGGGGGGRRNIKL
jgi:hypothetical protein